MSEDNIAKFYDKVKQFCVQYSEFNKLLKKINFEDSTSLNLVFDCLGVILLQPKHTFKIISNFRQELLTILCSTISFQEESPTLSYSNHVRICVVLSKVITLHPDVQNVAIEYFQKYPAPFEDYSKTDKDYPPRKKFKIESNAGDVSADIVSACYDLLCCKTDFFKTKWSWSTFMEKYYNHTDDMVKWKCFQCIRIVTGMNEAQFSKLLLNYMNGNSVNKCIFEHEFSNSVDQTEQLNKNEYQLEVLPENSKNAICVDGIYLPILKEPKKSNELDFLPVESTKTNLHKVALGIAANKAVCLQGPVGSGKTFLIEYLASITGRTLGNNFIKVQLSDQTDSKMLLGTCRCTDIPGEFEWQPGVLTQAVMEGNWLLLEDIDLASMDIASVLTALLENGCLTVPGYRDSLPIAPGFQLFVTQRLLPSVTGFHKKQSNVLTLLEKNILQINIVSLSPSELENIIQTIYPSLKTIASRLVDTFLLFSSNKSRSSRLVSTRDLFKWCKRSALNFDVTSQHSALNVLQNAIDIFCCSYSNADDRLNLASEISSKLGIISEKADYYCNRYKPDMSLTTDSLKSSRVSMQKESTISNVRMNFCFTRPAVCLLERIMCSVNMKEPVLLVGETGTGKTLAVQYLAHTIGVKLIVINMNQQSDSADLLGGYKPVDLKFVISPIKREFEEVFCAYFNVTENKKFLQNVSYCFNQAKWNLLIKLMQKSLETAVKRLTEAKQDSKAGVGQKRKHQDLSSELLKKNEYNEQLLKMWLRLGTKLQKLEVQIKHKNSLAFSFIEGSLVKAVANGYWVLLDEINLANAETLECLSGLLEGNQGSISLLERGDKAPIKRHSNFTLFACMNPSTDVGKRDLPTGLRNRFTEFYMDELTHKNDLVLLVNNYLTAMSLPQEKLENIVKFYLNIKKEAELNLCDGIGQKPHFSLRTLCRALTIAARNPCGIFNRSLYEAFCLSFLTQLDSKSYQLVENLIAKYILGNAKNVNSVLKQAIVEPTTEKCLNFEGYWVTVGHLEPEVPNNYILTQSVRRNLKDLVRVVSIGKSPVLLQGDTSVGKTSLIKYLAKSSGNKCVRINNHEHTDLQEYIGSYVADVSGKLIFREGLLVEAMRNGHWIILDELNLAPTDVLEALNRVLDDNRELFIPETQKTVKAHPNFMLFATQNPPGLYGGRKVLSRAFRNRFVELHFNDIPSDELEFILHKRCEMPPSYSKKMVAVMKDLQTRRRGSAAFAGKQGFITLRDLFRWGERYRLAQVQSTLYNWDQHLADEGYLLLAGRVRKVKEREEIVEVLQKHMKRQVLPSNLFTLSSTTSTVTKHILEQFHRNKGKHKNIVWTYNMCQLGVLVAKALEFHEPVLLVGETGGGKTTICKLLAEINNQNLLTVNCHMHTESSDFIGGLRPVREHSKEDLNRLFEWVDGPLIQAMLKGDVFLADEISLADDSVLERLNSLLEPERLLLLAEKGADVESTQLIAAHENFHFIGTMNPGGDHGKKELSLALRNRFTEIWCESCTDRDDLIDIIEHNITKGVSLGKQPDGRSGLGHLIMNFIEWFHETPIGKRFTVSIRDLLTWVNFINCSTDKIEISDAYLHGACLTFLDSFGSGVTSTESTTSLENFKNNCLQFILKQLASFKLQPTTVELANLSVESTNKTFGIRPFYLKIGNHIKQSNNFTYEAPTCMFNILRLLRGLQLNKAILLEGSPGVGKTSMVTALAKSTNNNLLRINLSDQTDISDLFGADLPVEGGTGGQFAWRDGPFLQALRKGYWILLDELNLASQSVLEGLNACLDHRGEVFIPELGKTFYIKQGTRLFASQNPLKQGGSRRGLPQSFLNRFTQVYIDPLNEKDLLYILTAQFSSIPKPIICKMVEFNTKVVNELESHSFGNRGSPWEFNLRDLTRWCEAVISDYKCEPQNLVQLIYCDRMRTMDDKIKMGEIFEEVFGCKIGGVAPIVYVTQNDVYLGDVSLKREINGVNLSVVKQERTSLVLRTQVAVLRSLAYCVNFNWMTILVGGSGSGKSSVVRTLANLVGKTLHTLPVTSAMDTTDILGGFEQVDYTRHLEEIVRSSEIILLDVVQECVVNGNVQEGCKILRMWENFLNFQQTENENRTMAEETQIFLKRLKCLEKIWIVLLSCDVTPANLKDQIKILDAKGKIINQVVRKEGNLNAGGKFEWVDSILIKCLQEGSWLLIDNVNLCSPAVLDRLNALLEPNGVLTIGERGVKENGEMVEIKPHKDFRLFLTMDPKNGEISRAMRNRGIEICMLNESEQGVTNLFDLKSLISQAGLKDNKNIETLLSMHNFISNFILGEKPNVNSLLQASFLISQELLRGRNVLKAFYEALVDVYYQTRSSNEFEPNFSLNLLHDNLKELIDSQNKDLQFYDDDVTMKTSLLAKQSQIEQIKQQGVLIRQLPMSSLINFYTMSNKSDLEARLMFAENIFQPEQVNERIRLAAVAGKLLNNVQTNNLSLPYDPHWTPDCNQDNVFVSNKLYLMFQRYSSLFITEQNGNKKNELTLEKFLKGVLDNQVEPKTEEPLERKLLKILYTFDGALVESLLNKFSEITDEQTIEAMSLMRWRFILERLLKVNIKQTNLPQYKALLTNLRVHYKWFFKFSVRELGGLLNSKSEELESLTAATNDNEHDDLMAFKKFAKSFQKCNDAPPPLINSVQIETHSKIQEISKTIDIYNKNFNKDILLDSNLRVNMINLKIDLTYDFSEEPQGLPEVVNYQSKGDIKLFDLEVLPVLDYFARLGVIKLKCSLKNTEKNSTMLYEIPTVPSDLIGALVQYQNTSDLRLLHEIKTGLFTYLLKSASVNPNVLSVVSEGGLERKESLPSFAPLFSALVTSLLVSGEESKEILKVTKYGNYRDVMDQHKTLSLVLWQNLNSLSSGRYDFIVCERQYLILSFSEFVHKISLSLNLENTPGSLNAATSLCIEKIKEIYSSRFANENAESPIVVMLSKCLEETNKLDFEADFNGSIKNISNVYILLNYIKAVFNSKLPLIDPHIKTKLKKQYCSDEIEEFTNLIHSYQSQNEILSCSDTTVHSYVRWMEKKVESLNAKLLEFGKYVAVRPENETYTAVTNEISHHFSVILSPAQILKSVTNLDMAFDEITNALNAHTVIELELYEKYVTECTQNIWSYEKLVKVLKTHRYNYPDIIEPLLNNLVEFLYGFRLKSDLHKKLLNQYKNMLDQIDLNSNLVKFFKFPVLDEFQQDYLKVINSYTNLTWQNFVVKTFREEENNFSKQENFRLLKCGLLELSNFLLLIGQNYKNLDARLFNSFDSLLGIFVGAWKKQEEEREAKKKADESLYKIKSKTEDEEVEDHFNELFPNFHDQDFSDMQVQMLDDTEMDLTSPTSYVGVITSEDVKFVSNLHSQLLQLYTRTEWLNPHKTTFALDFITPLTCKFKLFKVLLDKYGKYLNYTMDSDILSSLNVLIAISGRFGNVSLADEQIKTKRNFYKDANVEEVKGSFHVLEELRLKIEELLTEWPGHPGLQTIKSIIDRIYDFDITSPLSRFLTGFEILLTKCHDWEQNAHSGVSLWQYIQNLVHQIIAWRKIEMGVWKESLNDAFDRMNNPLQKWWFYLYEVMMQFTTNVESDVEGLISTLQKFITSSNLAEFTGRLNLLLTFHCHAVHLEKCERTDQFISVLWNIHEYFKQFLPNVEAKIKEIRSPIEKKLKDYIKIVKWKDISYWAIKETLEKTHKTLHKHIRDFEHVLNQPVVQCLVNTTSDSINNVGIWDRPQRQSPKKYHYTMAPESYIAKRTLSTIIDKFQSDLPILSKSEKYFWKARRLCKETISSTNYPILIQSLDGFVTEIIENSSHLQSLEVDHTLPKNKQKSQAKGILQQKRKALSDLFKKLSEIGLSFRTGIMHSKIKKNFEQFVIKPIDLKASFGRLNQGRDEKILTIWEGCEMYFLKVLMRLDNLESSLINPAKDLGMQNAERCRGFSEHLVKMIVDQKQSLIETSRILYYLKFYLNCVAAHCEEKSFISIDLYNKMQTILKNILVVMEQCKIIIQTSPEEFIPGNERPIPILEPEYSLNNENWKNSTKEIEIIINTTKKIISNVTKFESKIPSANFEFALPQNIPIANIDSLVQDFNCLSTNLAALSGAIGPYLKTNSIDWLNQEVEKITLSLSTDLETQNDENSNKFKKQTEQFLEKILIVVQTVYKKYKQKDANQEKLEEDDENVELKPNHIKTLIVEDLSNDMSNLQMRDILNHLHSLIKTFYKTKSTSIFVQIVPLLNQLVLLYEYFVTQQVSAYRVTCKMSSIIINIFIDLTTRGFCIPPEFSEELTSDTDGQNFITGGMGLGDGEGEKDVSDKIESEDQLEDAQPQDKEKKEKEDGDCKEEEKGIEMSEDFDSKLQDVEKGDDDDDENSDSDKDADEQMGETEKDADRLDQEIWGSDNEDANESENEEEKADEKGDKGEKEGENELSAKENPSKEEDRTDPSSEEAKEKNKKEINEMEEPELDDQQVDPYHGNQPEYPEPEAMDLPDDLNLDDDAEDKDEQQDETNPFDIDAMKEQNPPETDEKNDDLDKEKDPEETDDVDEDNQEETDIKESDGAEQVEEGENDEPQAEEKDEQSSTEKKKDESEDKDEILNDEQSGLDQTHENEDNVQAMDVDDVEATDNVQSNPSKNQKPNQSNENCQEDNPDKKGIGESHMEESTTGHTGQTDTKQDISSGRDKNEKEVRRKPGESDSKRSLGDAKDSVKKKLKTIDVQQNEEEGDEDGEKQDAEMYQHIKEAKESDHQVLDAATKEQAEQQKISELKEDEEPKDSTDIVPEDEEETPETNEVTQQKAEKLDSERKKVSEKGQHPDGDILENLQEGEIEGEVVETSTVMRGGETTHHTLYSNLTSDSISQLSVQEMIQIRTEVEQQLSIWNEPPTTKDAEQTWEKISSLTSSLAQGLSEQLRLVLEPTQASRLKGDYRTGKRINMRKVIPYIASEFRKDKIWLRRTKPSKRDYLIALAIDDSSSMSDNHSKELAFESVALISKALTLLESGQLSVLSFGESTEILHKLTDTFTDKSGVKLLQKFNFNQKKTCVAKLVDFASEMLSSAHSSSNSLIAKLLVIVSDGRGIFSEGDTYVQQAVRRAKLLNIFMVFVIVDNPDNKDSILDIRMPVFKDGKLLGIKSYMDAFPFPFYIILRDINSLPNVLSDALRQWFEIVASGDQQ